MQVRAGVRVKAYDVIARAVEEGTEYGWQRARKHVLEPEPEQVKDQIVQAVLGAIAEVFDFDEG